MAAHADPAAVAGKAGYGIDIANAFGLPTPFIRGLAKEIGRDQELALALWRTGTPECRLLAPMIAVPAEFDDSVLETWVGELTSWDVCDGFCASLVTKLPNARGKALAWSKREEEFVCRAGFATMAWLAVYAKDTADKDFQPFLKRIERAADDPRRVVKKAVNWALRQIGKRNGALNAAAITTAERILARDAGPARWIARDALKELRDPVHLARIAARG